MVTTSEITEDEKIAISFHRGKIVTRITLGLVFLAFIIFCLLDSSNAVKPIFVFLIWVSLHILIVHDLHHLIQYRDAKPGLLCDKNGITNNTGDTIVFIPWVDIEDFQTGFYRANQQIFIKVSNANKYHQIKRTAYLTLINRIGKFFRSKPDLLWIDVNLLGTNEKQLLSLLHAKWNEVKASQAS